MACSAGKEEASEKNGILFGNCIYCFGIALLTVLIRVFASYPEGMSFAVLIMNCVVPLIDKYIYPRPFGFVKQKKGGKE